MVFPFCIPSRRSLYPFCRVVFYTNLAIDHYLCSVRNNIQYMRVFDATLKVQKTLVLEKKYDFRGFLTLMN